MEEQVKDFRYKMGLLREIGQIDKVAWFAMPMSEELSIKHPEARLYGGDVGGWRILLARYIRPEPPCTEEDWSYVGLGAKEGSVLMLPEDVSKYLFGLAAAAEKGTR